MPRNMAYSAVQMVSCERRTGSGIDLSVNAICSGLKPPRRCSTASRRVRWPAGEPLRRDSRRTPTQHPLSLKQSTFHERQLPVRLPHAT